MAVPGKEADSMDRPQFILIAGQLFLPSADWEEQTALAVLLKSPDLRGR